MENIDYGFLSVLPPLIAIALAIATKQVILSLLVGIWVGSTLILNYNPFFGFIHMIDKFIKPAIADPDHAAIIIFSVLIGGMVGVMSKCGGTMGIVNIIIRWAKKPRSGQIATWLLGIIIFFDDYANTLIVGHTMRPITDKLKISREKLSFIVDSTAAPVAGLFVSTWIGYEVGLIQDALSQTGYQGNGLSVFMLSIPYRFYPILAILFVFLVAFMKRDFGPMLKAEERSFSTGKLIADGSEPAEDETDLKRVLPSEGVRAHWYNGVIPIVSVIVATLASLYISGKQGIIAAGQTSFDIENIISHADPFQSLFWSFSIGSFVAIFLAVSQRILSIKDAMNSWFIGIKSMFLAIMILVLAWSIGAVTKEMHTAEYLTRILQDTISAEWVPVLTFILAAIVSFATGTSWGTMAILMPLVLPLSWSIAAGEGLEMGAINNIFLATTSGVLAGSIFGDHCSPISDTTVMSSMASACDHIDHVRTQMPYAILVAIVSIVAGSIPSGFGVSPYISLGTGTIILVVCLRIFGKRHSISLP